MREQLSGTDSREDIDLHCVAILTETNRFPLLAVLTDPHASASWRTHVFHTPLSAFSSPIYDWREFKALFNPTWLNETSCCERCLIDEVAFGGWWSSRHLPLKRTLLHDVSCSTCYWFERVAIGWWFSSRRPSLKGMLSIWMSFERSLPQFLTITWKFKRKHVATRVFHGLEFFSRATSTQKNCIPGFSSSTNSWLI